MSSTERLGFSIERLERVSQWLQAQVDSERLAGASVLIGRHGQEAHFAAAGQGDVALGTSFSRDTLVRIYSMTKSITTVAAMMLYERGCFHLDDPVAQYLPAFAQTPVWEGGEKDLGQTKPVQQVMTIRHLMTHTSGLTYGFMHTNPVDAAYRAQGIEFPGAHSTLAELVDRLAGIPLVCEPGTQWNYSVSTDVLGRLVEVWSGQSLRDFLRAEVLLPLGMNETDFHVAPTDHARLASLYAPLAGGDMSNVANTSQATSVPREGGLKLQDAGATSSFLQPTNLYSGGGGLVSSIDDYAKFCQMLLNGGELNGARLLGRKTVHYMRVNHLPGNRDMAAMGQPVWSETSYDGIGFGLGFAVVLDPVQAQIITSAGEHHWGGAASTFFWIDPEEDLYTVLLTQLMPSSTYPIRRELRTRVYQALTG